MSYDYIPDLTERFPEGFDGVDMTPSFFGEPVDWSRSLKEDDYNIPYENETKAIFEVGQRYREVGFYGGVTIYIVKEIDRENNRILLAEEWEDYDGHGTRPAEWHKLESVNENERFLSWTSEEFGDFWVYAHYQIYN